MNISLAPESLDLDTVVSILAPYTQLVRGLGWQLAGEPKEAGWESFFDHPAAETIISTASSSVRQYAKDNQLFYSTPKLEAAVVNLLADAFTDGWKACTPGS